MKMPQIVEAKIFYFYFILILCLFVPFEGHSQTDSSKDAQALIFQQSQENAWPILSKISYKKQYNDLMGFDVDVPVFSETVKSLEGKRIRVKGYIIPVEGYKSHKEFAFSAFPYSMCFFCGNAGPETVMEVFANTPIEYTAESVIIEGTLSLNDTDINSLIYILKDVVLIK